MSIMLCPECEDTQIDSDAMRYCNDCTEELACEHCGYMPEDGACYHCKMD